MKKQWIATAAVLVTAASLIVYKEAVHTEPATPAGIVAPEEQPRVVLVADPREADADCGCGEIIRLVRSAREEGVAVLEVPPGSDASRDYRATVNPTVLFLGQAGSETARFEGEASDTVSAIRRRLDELPRQ